jgi:hypothetical protein
VSAATITAPTMTRKAPRWVRLAVALGLSLGLWAVLIVAAYWLIITPVYWLILTVLAALQ